MAKELGYLPLPLIGESARANHKAKFVALLLILQLALIQNHS